MGPLSMMKGLIFLHNSNKLHLVHRHMITHRVPTTAVTMLTERVVVHHLPLLVTKMIGNYNGNKGIYCYCHVETTKDLRHML